jgi:hypothetical protein
MPPSDNPRITLSDVRMQAGFKHALVRTASVNNGSGRCYWDLLHKILDSITVSGGGSGASYEPDVNGTRCFDCHFVFANDYPLVLWSIDC